MAAGDSLLGSTRAMHGSVAKRQTTTHIVTSGRFDMSQTVSQCTLLRKMMRARGMMPSCIPKRANGNLKRNGALSVALKKRRKLGRTTTVKMYGFLKYYLPQLRPLSSATGLRLNWKRHCARL